MGRLRTVLSICVDLSDKLLNLKCLRGLTLSGSCIKELPKSIGKLIHLRLLYIKWAPIKALPKTVTKLYNLQTLVIKDCRYLKELPNDLHNLISLRHIDIDHEYIKQLPINMGLLTCLQTLPFFVIGQDAGHRIEELGCLSQLRGGLSIYNLEHVRDREEAKIANLAGKTGVQKLGFHWSSKREGNNNDEDVLEGLRPHPHLKSLEIVNFGSEKFPSWILARDSNSCGLLLFDHLLKFRLSNCKMCEQIPTLGLLPYLEVLEIYGMDNVKCIGTQFYSSYLGEGSSNSRGGPGGSGHGRNALFPALKKLFLNNMPNLVEWKDAMEPATVGVEVFPCLEELTIQNCGQLTSAPCHFPSLKKLDIEGICSTTFERISSKLNTLTSLKILNISKLTSLPEQLLQNNTSLMFLEIRRCHDLVSISCSPHEDVWAFCTSLRSLLIHSCRELRTLPDSLHNLRSLEKFEVTFCSNVRSFPSIQGVTSLLRSLTISCNDEVLPNGLQSCKSLSELSISSCFNLISIPDLRELHSLTRLRIYSCHNLISIRDLRELHSLTQLRISSCDNLISIPDLRELHSLTQLKVAGCRKLTRLPEGLDCLTRLSSLGIGGCCDEVDVFPGLNSIQPASLTYLQLHGSAKLNSLPHEIQRFTALTTLKIDRFDGMEALPEWLGSLSSLHSLYIWNCKNLMYLPTAQAIRHLSCLHISNCPRLKERCAKGSGAEWSKIAHLLDITIY